MKLPVAPSAIGDYVPVIIRNGIGFVSGQFPISDDRLRYSGTIGTHLSEDEAVEAIKLATYNVLSQIAKVTSDFNILGGLLRLEGHLVCSKDYTNVVNLMNISSEIFIKNLGDKGTHARALFIHERLPLNSPVELCVSFSVL